MPSTGDARPELARLSERILLQEQNTYRDLLARAYAAIEEPRQGSLCAADRREAAGNKVAEASLAYAGMQFERLARSIEDHLEALVLMMQHRRLLLVPAWTVSRAILEPVLMSCWLTDPHVSSEMRIARAASLAMGVSQGTINQLRKYSEPDRAELPEKLDNRSDLVDFYKQHGFETLWERKASKLTGDVSGVRYGHSKASIKHNITQMSSVYLPEDSHLYGVLSGAAHGHLWLLNGLASDVEDAIRSIIAPLLPVSDAYTQAICTYVGLPAESVLTQRSHRLAGLMYGRPPVPTTDSSRKTAFGPIRN